MTIQGAKSQSKKSDQTQAHKNHKIKTSSYVLLYNKRQRFRIDGHPELDSGSVRGERQEKARGEMLKQVQHDNMK